MVGLGTAHVSSRARSFAPFSSLQGAHARPRVEDSALGQPHIECQGRRQRHSDQRPGDDRLRHSGLPAISRRATSVRRVRQPRWPVDDRRPQRVTGDTERTAVHHEKNEGRSGKRRGDERLEVRGDGG